MSVLKDIFAVIVFATGFVIAVACPTVWVVATNSTWGMFPGFITAAFVYYGTLAAIQNMIRSA